MKLRGLILSACGFSQWLWSFGPLCTSFLFFCLEISWVLSSIYHSISFTERAARCFCFSNRNFFETSPPFRFLDWPPTLVQKRLFGRRPPSLNLLSDLSAQSRWSWAKKGGHDRPRLRVFRAVTGVRSEWWRKTSFPQTSNDKSRAGAMTMAKLTQATGKIWQVGSSSLFFVKIVFCLHTS